MIARLGQLLGGIIVTLLGLIGIVMVFFPGGINRKWKGLVREIFLKALKEEQ